MARREWACGVCEAANQAACCAACVNLRYSLCTFAKLIEKYNLLRKLTQKRNFLLRSLNVKLNGKREAAQHWKIEHTECASKLLQHLRNSEKLLVQNKLKQEKTRRDLEARIKLLSAASAQLFTMKIELLEHLYPDLIRAQTLSCAASMSELNHKRRHIFRHLSKVFSCYRQTLQPAPKETDQHLRICGACLPIRDDPHSVSRTALSASLGYMVQLVNLFAHYLSTPLLHSAAFAASSSRIWQRASYWDAHPSSRSEEYPLFLPSTDKHGGARDSGYFPLENPGSLVTTKSSISFDSISISQDEADKDVKQGMMLLKRSISCICAYGYGMLSLPVPSNMSTFEALMELSLLMSSKESQTRYNTLQFNDRPDDSLLHMSGFSSHSQDSETPRNRGTTGMSDLFCIVADSKNKESFGKTAESVVEEWDVIDHPTLPPPSQSEDVEHWTRAMIVDATK